MRSLVIITLLSFLGINANARPTSNVINAVYSLQDDFFEKYGFHAMPFKDRVTICESPFSSVFYDSTTVSANLINDKYTLMLYSSTEGIDEVNYLYFRLVKDKKKKRFLLIVFNQIERNGWTKLNRVDLVQYDKKASNRWKEVNASDIFPKLTWNDLYQGISEKALEKTFTMKPALTVSFQENGNIRLPIAHEYIEMELKDVQSYLENNSVDANSITLKWDKNQSKYIAIVL